MAEHCKHRDLMLFVDKFVGECGAQLIRSLTPMTFLVLSWGFQAEITPGFRKEKKKLKNIKGQYFFSLDFQQTTLRNFLFSKAELEHNKLPPFFICNFILHCWNSNFLSLPRQSQGQINYSSSGLQIFNI